MPLPSGHEPRVRFGTVLERSCGRSGALLVRWEPEAGGGAASETWLPDANWHWGRAHIRIAHQDERRPADGPVTPTAGAPAVEPTSIAPVRRAMRHRVGADNVARDGGLDAAAEWDAALEADPWLTTDHDWSALLETALAPVDDFDFTGPPLPLPPPPPAAAPPAGPPAAPAAPADEAGPVAPGPRVVPAPAPDTDADLWGGDIVPGRGRRR